MSLEVTQLHDPVVDKYVEFSTTGQMTCRDYMVRITATSDLTVTLPPVAEAKGRFYSLLARSITSGATVTIAHAGDSENWSNLTMNTTGQSYLLYSDGYFWHAIAT